MSAGFRLLVDECCSPKVCRCLAKFFEESNVFHLRDYFVSGMNDEDWIPKLAKELDTWVIITGDQGKNRRTQRLPVLCKKYGLRHISFTGHLMSEGVAAQIQALEDVHEEIPLLLKLPKGAGAKLGYRTVKDNKKGVLRIGGKLITGKS